MTTSAMALHPESPKGGHINAPQVTDSLVYRVCDHNGLGCQVLWRMAQLVPHVPLRRRTWLDQSKMSSVADFVLTGDQKFDASSCGVSIGIIGISAIDLVNSYWAGHVGFSLKVALDVYLEHSGPVLSNETRQALQAASKSLAPQDLGQCRKALGSSAEGSYVSPLDSEITFPFNQLASANIEADEDGWTEDIRNFQKAVTAMSDSVGSNDWKTGDDPKVGRLHQVGSFTGLAVEECAAQDQKCQKDTSEAKDCGCGSLSRGGVANPSAWSASSEVAERHNSEMVEIPAGAFLMGDRKERVHFPQDRMGKLGPLAITGNAKFHDFVAETGYVTDAEHLGDSFVAELYLSERVLETIDKKVDAVPWWLPVPNASWRQPEGWDSGLDPPRSRYGNRWDHPAVHISWNDAYAYCSWRNATLPTEAQWEYASRGGLEGMYYPWGDTMYGNESQEDPGRFRMNIWQGEFPTLNTAEDGYIKTAPDWGLYNMVGNVWEWTSDWFSPVHFLTEDNQQTGFVDPTGPSVEDLEQLVEMGYLKKDASGAFEKIKKGNQTCPRVKAEFKKGKDALNHIMSNINQRAEGAAPFQLMDDDYPARQGAYVQGKKDMMRSRNQQATLLGR
eukprot:s1847_g2.t2